MDPEFWHARWAAGEIGFHEGEANPLLQRYLSRLELSPNSRIFVPLCGKTRDIAWLRQQGHRVVGAELNQSAVEALFAEMGIVPEIRPLGELTHYRASGLDIYQGDIFALDKATLGAVDAIYDRAALVALPEPLRRQYLQHLRVISDSAPKLLITFAYDQSQMDGPPFSIPEQAVTRYYSDHYRTTLLESRPVAGGLKGQVDAQEAIWLLN